MSVVQYNITPPLRDEYATIQWLLVGLGNLVPEQIIGLVPCQPASDNDCFVQCNCLPMFATLAGDNERQNDKNSFLFAMPTIAPHTTFRLQKYDYPTKQYEEIAILADNTYGTFFNTGQLAPYNDYSGYILEWQKVLQLHGQGYYRFVVIILEPQAPPEPPLEVPYLFSTCFDLREWSCDNVNNTFYVETTFRGNISNYLHQQYDNRIVEFDLASLATGWYDRCRYFGKIGNETYTKEITNVVPIDNSNRIVFASDNIEKTVQFSANESHILRRAAIYGMNSRTIYLTDDNQRNTMDYFKQQVIWSNTESPEYFAGGLFAYNMNIKVRNYLDLRFHSAGFN